ncbi:MAG: SDR family oxidoreductase [bacterium]|nr:SDR family oxidoreductase [bacterium]
MEKSIDLRDKVIFVAGGAGNVGSYIVKEFLNYNANVLTSTRNREKYEKLKSFVGNRDNLKIFNLDITDNSVNYKVIEYVDKVYGRLDGVVVAVGSWFDAKKILDTEVEFLLDVFKQRFITHFIIAKLFLRYMVKLSRGVYLSLAGYHAEDPLDGYGSISVSGASQIMLSKILTKELKDYKDISVNTILMPGLNTKIKGEKLANFIVNFFILNLNNPLIKGQIIKISEYL